MRTGTVLAAAMIGAVAAAGAAAYWWHRGPSRPVQLARTRPPLASRPAERPPVPEGLLEVPLYKQWDPAWAADQVGASGESMRSIGCVVCCVAMFLTFHGQEVTPGELNAWLGRNRGFTGSGLLKWSAVATFSGWKFRLVYKGDADRERLDRELDAGNPVLVRVRLAGGVDHWVLVVGSHDGEYYVNDPLGEEPAPVACSRFSSGMLAMRVLGRTGR
jgi:hypothetical protein